MTATTKEPKASIEAELYELSMPGRLIGKDPVDFSKVDAVGTVVQLNSVVKDAEEIEVHDVIRLQKEVLDDIKSYLGAR